MFTVIIAEQSVIDMHEEFKTFLDPMLDEARVAFCAWNREGQTLEEMLPGIYDIIAFQTDWRAIIVNRDGLGQINPFDFTQYRAPRPATDKIDWQVLSAQRAERLESYDKAIQNPLVRLTSALCGAPTFRSVVQDPAIFGCLVSGTVEMYEYMLSLQLQALNLTETAAALAGPRRGALTRFVSEDAVDALIDCVREGDAGGAAALVETARILDFIRFIGNGDPLFADPAYAECMVENTYKTALFESIAEGFVLNDRAPVEVLCVAPRTCDLSGHDQDISWESNDEHEYSRFAEHNLYPERLKYFVFDLLPEDNKQYLFDRIRMISFLLLLAGHDLPHGVVTPGRVYRVGVEFNVSAIEEACSTYLSKLKATALLVHEMSNELRTDEEEPLDAITAQELFESDITVSINASEYSRRDLFARADRIGLAGDCPRREYDYWNEQYHAISKRFVRYLREPRRALKTAVREELRPRDSIDDDRALRMTESQTEDVQFHLFEEEQNMVETPTPRLFDTAQYKARLDEADEDVRRYIAKRISRNKALATGGIATGALLLGFLPMLFSNLETTDSFLFSLTIVGIVLGLFLLAGGICLVVLRNRLLDRISHFNFEMSGICSEIEDGLRAFSKYLGHTGNVMRDFSVLRTTESSISKKRHILAYHSMQISRKTREAYALFSKYIDCDTAPLRAVTPYRYDFSVMRDYPYDIPYARTPRTIEFLQPGNRIVIQVDYVDVVTLTREELYE